MIQGGINNDWSNIFIRYFKIKETHTKEICKLTTSLDNYYTISKNAIHLPATTDKTKKQYPPLDQFMWVPKEHRKERVLTVFPTATAIELQFYSGLSSISCSLFSF